MTHDDSRLVLQGQQVILNEWFVHSEAGAPARRKDMQPAQFLAELAFISIVEAQDDSFIFRLAGTEIRQFLGVEARGRRIAQIEALDGAACWSESLTLALGTGRPAFGCSQLGSGQVHWWLRLPLLDDFGRVRFVMCHDRRFDADQMDEAQTAKVRLDEPLSAAA